MDQPELDARTAEPRDVVEGDPSVGEERDAEEVLEGGGTSTLDPPAEVAAAIAEPDFERAVIPIPGEPRRDFPAGGSFWQRIALRGRQSLSKGGDRHEAVMARLNELERRVAESQNVIESQIAALDRRLTQVWEVEEQLSYLLEIQEIVTGLQEQQSEIRDRVHSNRRTLNLLVAAFAVTAIAIASLALEIW